MKSMQAKTRNKLLLAVGILIVFIIPLFIKNGYTLQALCMVVMYAYLASSWNIISGFGGQFSLGHSVYFGIGAYVSTLLYNVYNISPWIGMLIGALVAGILAIIVSYPCFKLSGTYFTLSTLAFLHVIRLLVTTQDKIFGFETKGAQGLLLSWSGDGLSNMQFNDKRSYLYVILVFLVIVVGVSYYIRNSKTGYCLAAINTNQVAAESLGVNVLYYKLKAMFISAAFTAIGGTFYAQLIMFLDPVRIFGADLSTEIMVFAVVGGSGTIFGPLLGALLMVPINEFARSYFGAQLSGLGPLIYGCVLCIIVFFLPGGLLPNIKAFYKKLHHARSCKAQKDPK